MGNNLHTWTEPAGMCAYHTHTEVILYINTRPHNEGKKWAFHWLRSNQESALNLKSGRLQYRWCINLDAKK